MSNTNVMLENLLLRFLIYGAIGWCLEIIWTGIHSGAKKDITLTSTTSLWMFPIYGLIIIMEPIYQFFCDLPVVIRGGAYALIIISAEFLSGSLLKKIGACPWDYSSSKYNIKGIVRLDYMPVWFAAGLIFESIYGFIK